VTRAETLLTALGARGLTLAVAESLTGGLLADALVRVPGASAVFRGGIVAYATDLKGTLLGVDAALLAQHGAVHPDVARQMAEGVRRVCAADVGLATTGVAGPDPQDGHAPGEVFVAVATGTGTVVVPLALPGGRAEIRAAAVEAVLDLAADAPGPAS
jgi:nicotinamide-nucleotide amidase